MSTAVGGEPGQSQDPRTQSGSPTWMAVTQGLEYLVILRMRIGRELQLEAKVGVILRQSGMDCTDPK